MRNNLYYLIWSVFLFASCEEYYNPDIDVTSGILVVESHITNDVSSNYVKLTLTQDFYNEDAVEKASGASVELDEFGGSSVQGTESGSGTGYYTFAKTPVSGKSYFLKIIYNKDVYLSDTLVMPPLPSIDTLYTGYKIEKEYVNDAFGKLSLVEVPSREIYVDLPMSASLKYYRFTWRAVLQWIYTPPAIGEIPPPVWYGWLSKFDSGSFNLAGPKEFSTSSEITKHPILSLAYDTEQYVDSLSQIPAGWIIIIDQYGITKESYDFHEALNKQFEAEGSLFDPVLTQVYGNIHCKNNSKKIALGFFDLNSYQQHRYFFAFGDDESDRVNQRRINNRYDISNYGYLIDEIPIFWEYNTQ